MIRSISILLFSIVFSNTITLAQIKVEGYVYESGNRGFLKGIDVTLKPASEKPQSAVTDENGKYIFQLETVEPFTILLEHDLFANITLDVPPSDIMEGEPVYLSHEMKREPGYIFEITVAEKNAEPDAPKDALKGALVEVYNNTKSESVIIIDSLNRPDFKVNLKKGNHYTVLIRHNEFLSKRMEAFVDVEGCILCFEGIGDVRPGVSDNLTEKNQQGTLLANVEMERYYDGKIISISNIYYGYNEHQISSEAGTELKKAATFINDNPNLHMELRSHTDGRGRAEYNMELSQKRSEAAVRYLLEYGKINPNQIEAKGYGESELVEDCPDNSNCTEDQHAKNRRTELKLQKSVEDTELKSLADLKRTEKFESMLADLEFGGKQIRVNSEDDLPPSEDPTNGVKNKINKKKYTTIEEDNNLSEAKTDSVESVVEMEEIAAIIETAGALKVEGLEEIDSAETSFLSTTNHDESLSSFSGYKLMIHFSRFQLPEGHELRKKHKDLSEYLTPDQNYLYLIGNYSRKMDAYKALHGGIIIKYPAAYMIGFEKGERIY